MAEPPAVSPPHEAAPRARVAELLDRLSRINLSVVVVAPPDAARIEARERARDAAMAAGRTQLLDEATAAAREMALRAFAQGGFSGTWAVTDWSISVATAGDRVAAAAAYEEAATAAVAEDLVDDDTVQVLRETVDHLAGMGRLPAAGSLSELTALAVRRRGPIGAGLGIVVVAVLAGFFVVDPSVGVIAIVASVVVIAILVRREAALERPRSGS